MSMKVIHLIRFLVSPKLQSVHVNTLCDNIDVHTETGDLWMGCHPNGAKLSAGDPNDPAGSEVSICQMCVHLHNINS